MTFCLAIKVEDGLVGIADTRITTGAQAITARKVIVQQHGHHSLFVMTSGLRSVRDKALTYFQEVLEEGDASFDKLYKAVNALAEQVRRVAEEDRKVLEAASMAFDLHILVGGQLERDDEPKLFLLYPQGNWVEVSRGTPYFIIGASGYGKPLLDRALSFETPLRDALKMGLLAFDATLTSSTDVGFPIDVVTYERGSYRFEERRLERDELAPSAGWWNRELRDLIDRVPFPAIDQPGTPSRSNVRPITPTTDA